MGQMGHEELMVILAPNISNIVVVMVNIGATEVLQKNYFMLSDDNYMRNDLFYCNNSMLDVCPTDRAYNSQAICIVYLQHPNP